MGGPPASAAVERAARILEAGGLVAIPTETVYGLAADALNDDAVRAVFAAKSRPANNPLIVHVTGAAMARTLVADWPDRAARLADAFWPGPLTLVLPRGPLVPDAVTAGGPTVGVRAPDHPLALALIERLGRPIAAPSANLAGALSPTTPDDAREAMGDPDLEVLDGGPCRVGVESTVLWLADGRPTILRPGGVTREMLERTLGPRVETAPAHPDDAAPASPGRLGPHYAPRTPLMLFERAGWPASRPDAPGRAVVVWIGPPASDPRPDDAFVTLPASPAECAATLYRTLRAADAAGADVILVERPTPNDPAWAAVLDRLTRAARPA